ncbi:hypothetical protein WJX73_008189 [Symbiochloris irregularis]|uniref:Aldehyde dehydrogenase domain-containing protein n=1 Tax=Symbiochloris irregularis TaxID=706552 RepID=A0AAW1NZL3_9CHLO
MRREDSSLEEGLKSPFSTSHASSSVRAQAAVLEKAEQKYGSAHPAAKTVKPKFVIGGELVDSVTGGTFETLDPRSGDVIHNVADGSKQDVDNAVAAARKAFDEGPWPRMGGAGRGKLMLKLADLMDKHADELAALETLDNGKPYKVARNADIPMAIDHFRYFAGWADKIHGKTIPVNPDMAGPMFGYSLKEPIGVVGQITPFNFPLLMAAWKTAPALATGCTIVLKVAEQTPLTGLRLGELALEAGFPPGVLNVVTGGGASTGEELVVHRDVDKIAFTGSTEVGKIILKNAADTVKNVTMELGGKSPIILCKDADLDNAIELIHNAVFYNHGQNCCAGSRLFVHKSIHDEVAHRLAERAKARVVGDPFADDTEQGPQVDEAQMKKILGYIESGQEQGAQLLTGGKRHGDKGFYVEPTVFGNVKDHMDIAVDEIFGPVQQIMTFDDTDDVLRRANNTDYGLAAGVFSQNIGLANKLARGLKAGTVWVNTYNVFDHSMPFGGYKQSGIGREKGDEVLGNYLQTKAVYQALDGPTWA